ncbi:MAG: VOC family protein [Anaerolineales bacterium]
MEPRISIVTLGVADFERSWAFYRALGFETDAGPEGPIAFFKTNGTVLAIYPLAELAADVDPTLPAERSGFSGVTLAHNVRSREAVDRVLSEIEEAGGRIVKPAQETFWGGYSGYFADPDGHYWEVAFGEGWQFDEQGHLVV